MHVIGHFPVFSEDHEGISKSCSHDASVVGWLRQENVLSHTKTTHFYEIQDVLTVALEDTSSDLSPRTALTFSQKDASVYWDHNGEIAYLLR